MSLDRSLALRVVGTPTPQGSIAFKGMRGKKPILTSDNVNLKAWRALVTNAAQAALPASWEALDEPVMVSADFRMKAPQRPRWPFPAVKPDLDKLMRAILDGLADAGVYANDSRVTDFGPCRMRYEDAEHPEGATVVVEWGLV